MVLSFFPRQGSPSNAKYGFVSFKSHPEKFSVYYNVLQRFANYTTARTNKQNIQEYKKSYTDVTDIAEERGPSLDADSSSGNVYWIYSK